MRERQSAMSQYISQAKQLCSVSRVCTTPQASITRKRAECYHLTNKWMSNHRNSRNRGIVGTGVHRTDVLDALLDFTQLLLDVLLQLGELLLVLRHAA